MNFRLSFIPVYFGLLLTWSVRKGGADAGVASESPEPDYNYDYDFDANSTEIGSLPAFPHRIVGGSEAFPHEFPWIVLIRTSGTPPKSCGGSILSRKWVVTAAHCVTSSEPISSYTVTAGIHNKNRVLGKGKEQVLSLESIVPHPSYNPPSHQNDIALLNVKMGFQYNAFVRRPFGSLHRNSYLPQRISPTTGTQTIVAGWGKQKYGADSSSDVLRKVTTPIVDLNICRRKYRRLLSIRDSHICTGQEGKSSCQGDSGSPLLCRISKASFVLCALVSGAKGCGDSRYPQVNTNVAFYANWINGIIGK